MKSNKAKYGIVLAALTLSLIATPKINTFSESILGPHTAQAIGISEDKVTIMPSGIVTSNTINVKVPEGSVGASFGWSKGGTTKVMKPDNSGPATSVGTTADQNWAPANKPNTPQPIYSITNGSSYRLTNVGKTTDGQVIDMIITVTGVGDTSRGPTAAAFLDSASLGGETDPYHSIAVLASGYHSLTTNIKYMKAGTNTPITLTSGTYWSDIDIKQGVNEDQSNSSVIVPPLDASKLAIDGKVIYSTTMDDANGMNDPNIGAYIGIGTGSEFNMKFYNPYTGGKNSPIGDLSTWGEFRYDLFGNFDNIRFPSPVTDPKKTVSDVDENKVPSNSTGLTVRDQEYDISVYVGAGSGPDKLILKDTFPKEFKTDLSKVKITGKNGKDVTSLFDLKLDGQNFTATMKDSSKGNTDLILTRVNVNVKGTLPDWSGVEFKNQGIWTSDKDLPTNEVSSVTPSKPEVVKSVSVDNGANYDKADTPETALGVTNRPDSYIWKLDYTLSNYTNYTGIQLIDHMESLQAINKDDVKVYDSTGADVTSKGEITSEVVKGKTDVKWVASKDYITEVNTKFGIKSKEKPKFTMTIKTDVKNATNAQEAPYYDEDLGYVVIPNTGSLIESDHTGDVSVDSNTSHVKFPKPGKSDVSKMVALDGTDPLKDDGWSQSLELPNHDELYSYKTTFKLSKDFNYDENKLVLTDRFENIQKYDSVKMIDSTGKDRTAEFNFTESKENDNRTTIITAIPKVANTFDDKGETLIMVISGVTWKGATAKDELVYLEPNETGTIFDDKNPFKEGVTIPNTSNMKQNSSIPKYTTDKDTEKTYVNLTINPSIEKYVEDDSLSVIDPGQASDSISLKDAVGLSQNTINNLDETASSDETLTNLAELRKVLLDSNATAKELLDHAKRLLE